ncbi:histidine kinase [Piscinibacter sp. XHJ-5]|uniref:sensor histidine kinase n=1 Tax=Piscinibacter sp. XHJ-5 TaxID=3037797 RepID=UPI00245303B1|nr:histidine kinase [Piscinibacter sp. XHJ-5]
MGVLSEPTPVAPSPSMLSALTLRRVIVAIVLAISVAAALNPLFITPFVVLLGRTLVIAMVLLLVFIAAGLWRPSWIPSWLARVVAVAIAAPIATFVAYLPAVGGDVSAVLAHEGRVSGFILIAGCSLVIGPLLALGAMYRERDAQARNDRLQFALEKSTLERQALDARLRLLHAQIEPHFLFNTLANVQELVESGSPQAGPVLKHLIAYLRAAVPRLSDEEPVLSTELGLVRAYLELMHMRMPDRLHFHIAVPMELHALRFPSMALLTLVENAIRHGIDPTEQGGSIEVGASREAASGLVKIWVADTGRGMNEKVAAGTGLTNLRARMKAFYGDSGRLELQELVPQGLRAELSFDPQGVAR